MDESDCDERGGLGDPGPGTRLVVLMGGGRGEVEPMGGSTVTDGGGGGGGGEDASRADDGGAAAVAASSVVCSGTEGEVASVMMGSGTDGCSSSSVAAAGAEEWGRTATAEVPWSVCSPESSTSGMSLSIPDSSSCIGSTCRCSPVSNLSSLSPDSTRS